MNKKLNTKKKAKKQTLKQNKGQKILQKIKINYYWDKIFLQFVWNIDKLKRFA